ADGRCRRGIPGAAALFDQSLIVTPTTADVSESGQSPSSPLCFLPGWPPGGGAGGCSVLLGVVGKVVVGDGDGVVVEVGGFGGDAPNGRSTANRVNARINRAMMAATQSLRRRFSSSSRALTDV